MIPLKAGNFLTSSGTNSFLRISLLDGAVSTALFKKITVNISFDICVVIIGLLTVYLKYTAVGEVCVSPATDMTISKANIFTSGCLFSPLSYSQSASI
jgi:hypothetical protein